MPISRAIIVACTMGAMRNMKEQGNLLATKIHFSSSAITDDMLLLVNCKKSFKKKSNLNMITDLNA